MTVYQHTPRPLIRTDQHPVSICENDLKLLIASQEGDLDTVKNLIESGICKSDLDIEFYATPLGLALDARQIHVAEYLATSKAPLNDHFIQFANSGDLFSIAWLLCHGARPTCVTSCVAYAASNGHEDVAKLFLSMGGKDVNTINIDMFNNDSSFQETYSKN